METSLRYGGESKSKTLKLHAKQKFPIADTNVLLQAHAELDAYVGIPNYLAFVIRHFYPQSSASLGVGVQSDRYRALSYNFRAKKEIPLNSSGNLRLGLKGRCDVDREFIKRKGRAAAELCWYKFDFQKDQDLRLKVGYDIYEKVPYGQICENNWTFNLTMNGNWNVKYHL